MAEFADSIESIKVATKSINWLENEGIIITSKFKDNEQIPNLPINDDNNNNDDDNDSITPSLLVILDPLASYKYKHQLDSYRTRNIAL